MWLNTIGRSANTNTKYEYKYECKYQCTVMRREFGETQKGQMQMKIQMHNDAMRTWLSKDAKTVELDTDIYTQVQI